MYIMLILGLLKNAIYFLKEKLIKMSFRQKLIFTFVVVSIIPILILQTVSYYNTYESMTKKVSDLEKINLQQTAQTLEANLSSYTDILYQIFMDDEIIQNINILNNSEFGTESAIARNVIKNKLKGFAAVKEGIRNISILCESGRTVSYDPILEVYLSSSSIWSKYKDVRDSEAYKVGQNTVNTALLPTKYVDEWQGRKYYLFSMVKKMYDLSDISKGGIGVIVISIDEDMLSNSCNQYSPKDTKEFKSLNFIVDKDMKIVSFPDKQLIGTHLNRYNYTNGNKTDNLKYSELLLKANIFEGKPLIINEFSDEKLGWTIVNAVDRDYLFGDIYNLQRATIIFGLLTITASLLLILYISGGFSKSIKKILKAMKTAQEGELSVQVDFDSNDEISSIAMRFNKMMVKIKELVEEVKNATTRQKDAEIRALEAQINPHFLYNTLDSINWMAISHEEYEISRMLKSLAQILRYSIDKSNKQVQIREEVAWLRQYIYLQQNRFDNSFESIINIDDEVLEYRIYKLLLQPFIENAIIHGFEGYDCGGIINICIKPLDESLISITISDNGKGINEKIIKKLNEVDDNDFTHEGSGLGIKNVFKRLKMYYPSEGNWNIESVIGKGTTVTIVIPRLL